MNFFKDHAVLFALICAGIGIAYGAGLTIWLLRRPAGNERMQEIARAIQEGAAAYLRRQYMTIATIPIVVYCLRRYAAAPSWMARAISCMRSLPAGRESSQ